MHVVITLRFNKIAKYVCMVSYPHGVNEQGDHWFSWWLFACSTQSLYLNQCWPIIVNWTPLLTSKQTFQEYTFENVICKTTGFLFKHQCSNIGPFNKMYHYSHFHLVCIQNPAILFCTFASKRIMNTWRWRMNVWAVLTSNKAHSCTTILVALGPV